MRDIAAELGISHATVSLALRGSNRITEAVRQRVQATAEALGYRPDPMLAALSHYRKGARDGPVTAALAWINAWPHPEHLRSLKEFDQCWTGAQSTAAKFGYALEEFRLGTDHTAESLHEALRARGIHGLLIPPQTAMPDWTGFPWQDYAIVRLGRALPEPRCHLVAADQVANTCLAFRRIREAGYARVGFVSREGESEMDDGHSFQAGCLIAQQQVPPVLRLPVFTTGGICKLQLRSAFLNWVHEHRPDAIFSDDPAIGELIRSTGLRVPEDIGLAISSVLAPTVEAGIDLQPAEIGRVGFLLLNSLLTDRSRGLPDTLRRLLVEGSWQPGKTLPLRA